MSKVKTLYRGTFQTNKSLFIERVYAYSERQAWMLICKRIAKKQGAPYLTVVGWFSDPEQYTITPEVVFEEVE